MGRGGGNQEGCQYFVCACQMRCLFVEFHYERDQIWMHFFTRILVINCDSKRIFLSPFDLNIRALFVNFLFDKSII